ncbi:methylenetetrahydrofolate reductase [NAD(P)H] [Chloroflexota bacterium]
MKVTDTWNVSQSPTISFELFPAKSEKAAAGLERAIDILAALKPDFVSVTFGAGGSTREGSRQLVYKLKHDIGLEVVAYFACYGLGTEDIIDVLDSYHEMGVESILAVRGDTPREKEFEPHPESLPHASDLVSYIRPRYDFCIGVAGYPEGHVDAASKDKDLEYLKLKVDQGAEYIVTNYFYDNSYFFDFVDRCRSIGIEVPIIPGVMPIYSIKMMEMLASMCGATIPDEVRMGIAALGQDDQEALLNFGIEYAVNQCLELLAKGAKGIHFYTMDRSRSTASIVERLRSEGIL